MAKYIRCGKEMDFYGSGLCPMCEEIEHERQAREDYEEWLREQERQREAANAE
jgi:hypothetical protein